MAAPRHPLDKFIATGVVILGVRMILQIVAATQSVPALFYYGDLGARLLIGTLVTQYSLRLSLRAWSYVLGVASLVRVIPLWPILVIPVVITLQKMRADGPDED